jgi:hypothetical protein
MLHDGAPGETAKGRVQLAGCHWILSQQIQYSPSPRIGKSSKHAIFFFVHVPLRQHIAVDSQGFISCSGKVRRFHQNRSKWEAGGVEKTGRADSTAMGYGGWQINL